MLGKTDIYDYDVQDTVRYNAREKLRRELEDEMYSSSDDDD